MNERLSPLQRAQRLWSNLPTLGRIAVAVLPAIVLVGIIALAIGTGSRDEGSYQYGRSALSSDARILWNSNRSIGAETGDYGTVKSIEDACRIVIDSAMKVNTAQAESMSRMDKDDMLAGCTDVLETETHVGAGPSPQSGRTTTESARVAAPPPQQTAVSEPTPSGSGTTIAEYITQNGITETPVVRRGDPPGSPYLDLPSPPGWKDSGNTPSYAYGQLMSTDPRFASEPPTITALFARLTGDVDADALLRYAPNELKRLPGYQADHEGPDTLTGYRANTVSGTYLKDGVRRVIASKTVVIPGRDGLYVLQLNVNAANDGTQGAVVTDAFRVINDKTRITP
jgi:hypothetical protein